MSHNFTDAIQTLDVFHPVAGCGTGQPVSMTYKGQRCSSNSASGSSSSSATILWQTAEPAPGSGLDASKCTLQRRTGTAAEDLIWNMDWFGSCGVPPARVLHIPRSECPAPPPPPPPSPSPRPEDQKALDRGEAFLKPFFSFLPAFHSALVLSSRGFGWMPGGCMKHAGFCYKSMRQACAGLWNRAETLMLLLGCPPNSLQWKKRREQEPTAAVLLCTHRGLDGRRGNNPWDAADPGEAFIAASVSVACSAAACALAPRR